VTRLVDENNRLKGELEEKDRKNRKLGGLDDDRELKRLRK